MKVTGPGQLVAGALAAVQAATASLVVVLLPVVLTWATAAYSRAPWGSAVRTGVSAWLLGHHAGLEVPGGHVGLVPLGLTAVPLVSCWLAGVRLARTLDPRAEAVRAGVGRARPVAPPPRAMMALVLTYAGLVGLAALMATSATVRPVIWQAFAGAAVLCAVASVSGAAAWVASGVLPGLKLVPGRLGFPPAVRRCTRPLAIAVGGQLTGGLLLVVAGLIAGHDEVLRLHQALAPGLVGGLVLTLAQLTLLPNLAIWAGAWSAGPGFAVGAGTVVQPGHTVLGPLPALPFLGALPPAGDGPAFHGLAWATPALPVLAGILAGWWLLRSNPARPVRRGQRAGEPRDLLRETGVLTLLATTAWTGLAWASAGPAGPGRLSEVGPVAWQVGLASGAEVGAGALLCVAIGLLVRRLAAPAPPHEPGPELTNLLG
jgi:Family of unknown function (DUF6350)